MHTWVLGARKATWSTALSSVRLIFSPLNMASIFFLSFARSAKLVSSCTEGQKSHCWAVSQLLSWCKHNRIKRQPKQQTSAIPQ